MVSLLCKQIPFRAVSVLPNTQKEKGVHLSLTWYHQFRNIQSSDTTTSASVSSYLESHVEVHIHLDRDTVCHWYPAIISLLASIVALSTQTVPARVR